MQTVLVSGANGGIGVEICRQFDASGWYVIATDVHGQAKTTCHDYVSLDLNRLCTEVDYRGKAFQKIKRKIRGASLQALINNAALQIVEDFESLTLDDWISSFNVNVHAPFILVQSLLPELNRGRGSVLNIGTIHARLTKARFSAYSTSKTALAGLTRALAVELGGQVRVNSINPAAIETPMLKAGFEEHREGYELLQQYHPSGCIGKAEEIGRFAVILASEKSPFLNGVEFNLDGGISSVLHDPD